MFRLHFFHVFPQVDTVNQTLVFHSNSLPCCASDTQTRPRSVQESIMKDFLGSIMKDFLSLPNPEQVGPARSAQAPGPKVTVAQADDRDGPGITRYARIRSKQTQFMARWLNSKLELSYY